MIIIKQIPKIKNLSAFPGFVKTVCFRYVIAKIKKLVRRRRRTFQLGDITIKAEFIAYSNITNAINELYKKDRKFWLLKHLARMNAKDREIITRCFILEQSNSEVKEAMNLNETQFRLCKSRAIKKLRYTRKPNL